MTAVKIDSGTRNIVGVSSHPEFGAVAMFCIKPIHRPWRAVSECTDVPFNNRIFASHRTGIMKIDTGLTGKKKKKFRIVPDLSYFYWRLSADIEFFSKANKSCKTRVHENSNAKSAKTTPGFRIITMTPGIRCVSAPPYYCKTLKVPLILYRELPIE